VALVLSTHFLNDLQVSLDVALNGGVLVVEVPPDPPVFPVVIQSLNEVVKSLLESLREVEHHELAVPEGFVNGQARHDDETASKEAVACPLQIRVIVHQGQVYHHSHGNDSDKGNKGKKDLIA